MLIKVIEPPTSVAPQPKVDLIKLQLFFSPNQIFFSLQVCLAWGLFKMQAFMG
jgi:hypothetical protein